MMMMMMMMMMMLMSIVSNARNKLAQRKLHDRIGPSISTDKQGKSAGVAIASRCQRSIAPFESPEGFNLRSSRFGVCFWPRVLPQGVVIVSVYPHDGIGFQNPNLAWLQ
mmetsp:Transcript_166951/g.530943  ORF Transcript_166951/g.530943 Transcript_166951/m.530943 type:complete len:109 (-) Transcript_166951:111-437(-)